MIEFPKYIINELGEKLVPNTGNLLFLQSCIYTSCNYPVRLLIDEGGEKITCTFVVYITSKDFICIDTSSVEDNFQSVIKIPTSTFEDSLYQGCKYVVYVKENLTK